MTNSSDNLFANLLPNKEEEADPNLVAATSADEDGEPTVTVSELDMLKSRAKTMGITFSNNIGVEALKKKIQDKMDGVTKSSAEAPAAQSAATQYQTLRQKMIAEEMKLVRLRITNLDPKKKDLPGEIITFANSVLGTVRKFVPFGEVTDNGFHVPYCIYKQLRDREFLNIKVRKVNGREVIEQSWAREFALEILPPLTREELDRLAAAQMAKNSID